MKITLLLSLTTLGASAALSSAATITDHHYTTNEDLGVNEQYFLEATNATWTIDSGVTVTGGRYFIGSKDGANDNPANFTVAGGGTLEITRNGVYNLRFGQYNSSGDPSEIGTLTITGGSKVLMTGSTPSAFMEVTGSKITLEGQGSTFQWAGTWDDTTKTIVSQQKTPYGKDVPLFVSGGTLKIQTDGDFTTATVVPEPSSAMLALLGLGLLFRRKRS